MCRAYGYVCVCVKMTGLYTVDETRTRGDARPVTVFLSRANQTCQSIKRRCHGNDVNTREGHKMECVFPPCWAAVMSGTQLKPRTHTHAQSVLTTNYRLQYCFITDCFLWLKQSRQDVVVQRKTDESSDSDKVDFILYLGNMKSWFLQTIRDASLWKGSIFIQSWDKNYRFENTGLSTHRSKHTHTGAHHILARPHTYRHTHTSQQVHRLIRVFPAVWRGSVGCRHHLPQLRRDLTPSATHTPAASWANASSKQCVLSYPQGRLLVGWWMRRCAVCPPFVNKVIEAQWHPALATSLPLAARRKRS